MRRLALVFTVLLVGVFAGCGGDDVCVDFCGTYDFYRTLK
jgi:hypothetical protein